MLFEITRRLWAIHLVNVEWGVCHWHQKVCVCFLALHLSFFKYCFRVICVMGIPSGLVGAICLICRHACVFVCVWGGVLLLDWVWTEWELVYSMWLVGKGRLLKEVCFLSFQIWCYAFVGILENLGCRCKWSFFNEHLDVNFFILIHFNCVQYFLEFYIPRFERSTCF